MKTSSAKQKARLLQQHLRDRVLLILKPYGVVAEDVKSTPMGVSGVDLQLSPFAKQFLPVAYECKSHKSFAIYSVYEQAQGYEGEPVAVIKANNKKPLAVLSLDYYMMLEEARLKGEELE